jgi:Ca2+-binding RTX toxin-like protein
VWDLIAVPQIATNDLTVNEVENFAVFDVTLDAASADRVTVEWVTQNGPGPNQAIGLTLYNNVGGVRMVVPIPSLALYFMHAGSDFQHDFGTVTFAPGETRQTVSIPIIRSGVPDELDETFSVVLANPTGATIADATGVGTILDDELHTTPTIAVAAAAAAEPYLGHGTTTLAFRVTLTNRFFQDVTVDYTAQDGSALGGSDFTALSGTLTFASGETEKTLLVSVLGDAVADPDETMTLVLSNPQGGILGAAAQATGSLQDTPVPPPEPTEPHFSVILNQAMSYPLATPLASPPAGLSYVLVTTDGDEAILGTEQGDFINGRGGNDALNGNDGHEVLDGGTGSNILAGGAGTDMFFIDARPSGVSHWTTITDLAPGERAVIWLADQLDFPIDWADGWGPATLEGLTLVTQGLAQPVAVTLTGYTVLDQVDGRIQFGFGHDAGTGSDYLFIAPT